VNNSGAGQATPQYAFSFGVHAVNGETVLCQVDADGGNSFYGMASCKGFIISLCIPAYAGWGHPIIFTLKSLWRPPAFWKDVGKLLAIGGGVCLFNAAGIRSIACLRPIQIPQSLP
jgi:hypothetical protein